jgi:hypothetical protein
MNQALPLKTRNRRIGSNRAPAIRNRQSQLASSTESANALQAQRLKAFLNCSEAVAITLARLVYGEGRRS